jgi:hypothetical protein
MKKNVFHPLISKLKAFTAGWVSLTFLTLIFAIPQAAAPPEPSESPAFRQPVASSAAPHTSVSSEAKDTPQRTPTVSEQNTVTHLTPVYYNQKDALWKDAAYGSDPFGHVSPEKGGTGSGRGFGVHSKASNGTVYRIFICPSCGGKFRVPQGVGRVTVKCPHCGRQSTETI